MDNRLGKWLLIFGLVLWLGALWKTSELPMTQAVQAELLDEPVQMEVSRPPIEVAVGGIDYQVKPLYKYELYGMVVSKHNADTWWDFLHKEWNDKLNVTDLCVVWGNNVRSGAYREIAFSSGQFTCNYQTSSSEAWAAFDTSAISNNHLLSADPAVARRMSDVRIGDQIHFSGYLAEYSHNHGFPFKRGTSSVRTDTGNGACETVFVERFEVLRRGGGKWPAVQWAGIALMVLGVLAWLSLPVRLK